MTIRRRTPRRSTDEVRALVREAAQSEFMNRGYNEATMRSIAENAGVSTSVVYRHFASKEELSRETLMAPFLAFLREFAAAASAQRSNEPWNDDLLTQEFVRDMHAAIVEHRSAVLGLIALGDPENGADFGDLKSEMRAMFAELRRVAEPEAEARGWTDPALVEVTNRLVIAMVTGLALLQPWLTDEQFTEEVLLERSADLTLYGIRLGRGAPAPADSDG